MVKYLLAKLHFRSPLHVGESGIGLENITDFVHSDTLFSAICHAWTLVYGSEATDALISRFVGGQPPFLLSSLLPFDKDVFYLPRPLGQWPVPIEYRKEFKKTRFLSLSLFNALAAGQTQTVEWANLKEGRKNLNVSNVPYSVPRVALDRVDNSSAIFYCGLLSFAPSAGLYLLAAVDDATVEPLLRNALSFLGEAGLGGERSSGCGHFEVEWVAPGVDWDGLLQSEGQTPRCSLSLFHPGVNDAGFTAGASYEVIERKGWAHSPLEPTSVKRKTCRMLVEGSVFRNPVHGAVVDVTPAVWRGKHRLYRYGVALTVPVGGMES